MAENLTPCSHAYLVFQSGGFYVACQNCGEQWVAKKRGGADTDIDHSRSADQTVGERFAFCCSSFDIAACDCVNKDHGIAFRNRVTVLGEAIKNGTLSPNEARNKLREDRKSAAPASPLAEDILDIVKAVEKNRKEDRERAAAFKNQDAKPVAWRVLITDMHGSTHYVYTETLPFEPLADSGVKIRKEPEALGLILDTAQPATDREKELETLLGDVLSWFDSPKPSKPEWRIPAGEHGADAAIEAARVAIAKDDPE